MTIAHTPDAEQAEAKLIVEQLHDIASRATGGLRDTLEQAAAMLDAYQAGLVLATPHPCTGYVLERATDDACGDCRHRFAPMRSDDK